MIPAKGTFIGILFIFMVSLLTFGCKERHLKLDWETLIKKYEKRKDSLYLESVLFLRKNSKDITAEKVIFFDKVTGDIKDIRLDTITSYNSLIDILNRQNINFKTETVNNSFIFTTDYIDKYIERSVSLWRQCPWDKNMPDSLFLNYLLPYKVLWEAPSKNADFFVQRNKYIIDSFRKINATSDVIYRRLISDVEQWFSYTEGGYTLFSHSPSLDELLCGKRGECVRFATLYTYMLRSAGIPATINLVPIWGCQNGAHAEVVFMDSTGKMVMSERNRLHRGAKIFRMTFKNQAIWSTQIEPIIGNNDFALPFLKNDHWLDVTNEHNNVTDIVYDLPKEINVSFAYICVFDYGNWTPIFWGKVEKGSQVTFKKMGVDMLYHIAIPDSLSGFKLIGKMFLADTNGNTHNIIPQQQLYPVMKLSKTNTGRLSWVKKGDRYTLEYYGFDGKWDSLSTQTCNIDSAIVFKTMPSNTVYRLVKQNGERRLERPFTYENGKLYWR